MNMKLILMSLLGGAALALGGCANEQAAAPVSPPLDEYAISDLYFRLADGASLYVGTIVEIKPEPNQRIHDEWGKPLFEEHGELTFRVEKTLYGQSVPELHMPYRYSRADNGLISDWGGTVWDDYPPRHGRRLAMLIYTTKDRQGNAERITSDDWPCALRDAPLVNPFIQKLTEACGFISASVPEQGHGRDKDRVGLVEDRIRLVKRFGGSKYPTIREFVRDAVFGSGEGPYPESELASATPELMLEYLRASSTIENDNARTYAVGQLSAWLLINAHFHSAPNEVRSAFADYWLASVKKPEGDRSTISALGCLQTMCRNFGVQETVELFPNEGRAGLIKRVTACATSHNRYYEKQIQHEARKLLELLKEK